MRVPLISFENPGEHTLDPAREENEGAYFHCLTANGFYFLFYSTRHTKKDRITVQ